jgi:translation initiation factor IF-2
MSVRIYQLSKQLNLENKELIAILNARGLSVDSPSNTIPNIYADALIEEYAKGSADEGASSKKKEEHPLAKSNSVDKEASEKSEGKALDESENSKTHAPTILSTSGPKFPPPVAAPKMAPGIPQRPQIASPAAASQISSTATRAPSSHAVPANALIAPRLAPEQKPSFVPPVTPRNSAHTTGSNAKSTGSTSQPLSGINVSPSFNQPQIIPGRPHPGASTPSSRSISPQPSAHAGKTLACKPPIIVRDFAVLLDMKPFRLISELMEIGIFASMNQVLEPDVAISGGQNRRKARIAPPCGLRARSR